MADNTASQEAGAIGKISASNQIVFNINGKFNTNHLKWYPFPSFYAFMEMVPSMTQTYFENKIPNLKPQRNRTYLDYIHDQL